MRKIILLLSLLLALSQNSYAQQTFVQNEALAEIGCLTLGPCAASVDSQGVQFVKLSDSTNSLDIFPISGATSLTGLGSVNVGYGLGTADTAEAASTTTVINATTHVARVGDALYFTAGTAGNIGVWSIVSAVTANTITLANALPATPAAADAFLIYRPMPLGKPEDSAANTGDALVGVAGVINTGLANPAANGDYASLALASSGAALNMLIYDGNYTVTQTPLISEDFALTGNAGIGIKTFLQAQDPITGDVGASGDATYPKGDLAGRTVTTLAPAGESYSTCGTSTASTADTSMKATAGASSRNYITGITCKNTSATVATSIDFKDGSTVIAVGGVSSLQATASGSFAVTFPVPLRGSANTAVNFAANVAVSSLTCCASGYISTI